MDSSSFVNLIDLCFSKKKRLYKITFSNFRFRCSNCIKTTVLRNVRCHNCQQHCTRLGQRSSLSLLPKNTAAAVFLSASSLRPTCNTKKALPTKFNFMLTGSAFTFQPSDLCDQKPKLIVYRFGTKKIFKKRHN